MSKSTKIIIAYVLGQITQLVIHGMELSFNMWNNRQIPFCIAAGFIIVVAVLAGTWIVKPEEAEPKHEKKSYLEWAEIPDVEEEVVNPIAKKP